MTQHESDIRELNERLTKQQDDIFSLRQQIAICVNDLRKWQLLAEMLATNLKSVVRISDRATLPWDAAKQALDSYESAKTGKPAYVEIKIYEDNDGWPRRSSIPDPYAEAVKRMEAVPEMDLERVWTNAHRTRLLPCINAVRARLIAAAKGEQP